MRLFVLIAWVVLGLSGVVMSVYSYLELKRFQAAKEIEAKAVSLRLKKAREAKAEKAKSGKGIGDSNQDI